MVIDHRVAGAHTARRPSWARWTLICGLAEVVGMAAAAGAAVTGIAVVGEPTSWTSGSVVWLLALAGGVVEGLSVGGLQFLLLRGWLPGLSASRYVGATVAVAAAGWALGMTFPAFIVWQLPTDSSGVEAPGGPGQLTMLAIATIGGAVMGAITGAVFGAAQAWALRGHVLHPRAWVWANVWGWAVGMTIIMVGATTPSASWPVAALLGLGALTGLVAGLAVGAVTWLFLPALVDAAPRGGTWANRRVLGVLRSPAHALLSASLLDLQYQGRHSHREYALPVQYARAAGDDTLVVCPGRPQTKSWWRNFSQPQPVRLTVRGEARAATAQVVRHDVALLTSYRARWPKVTVTANDPVVRLMVHPRHAAEPSDS